VLVALSLAGAVAKQFASALRALAEEQAKSERLLLNILPPAIAQELKRQERTITDSFAEATVMFADLVDYTELAAQTDPTELIEILLNVIFSEFDQLTEEHGLEKIQTIGDVYMVFGGLPMQRPNHAEAIGAFKFCILILIFSSFNMTSQTPSIHFFEGLSEELSNVSLRRNRYSGVRTVLMTFNSLKALEKFNSFTKKFSNSMVLTDEEGVISVEPSSVKFLFGGPEGDELNRVECHFEIEGQDHWERFMRFMNRYAEANGMVYGETGKSIGSSNKV
jgi:photosystem II Psb28-2 protein